MSVKVVSQNVSAVTHGSRDTGSPSWAVSRPPASRAVGGTRRGRNGTIERVVPTTCTTRWRLALHQAVPLGDPWCTPRTSRSWPCCPVSGGDDRVRRGSRPGACSVPGGRPRRRLARAAARDRAGRGRAAARPRISGVELRDELGLSGPAFETELDPTGGSGPLSAETVSGSPVLEGGPSGAPLRHRRDVLDAGAASRIVGYHLPRSPTWSPTGRPAWRRPALVGPAELRAQVDGLAGPEARAPGPSAARALRTACRDPPRPGRRRARRPGR